MGSRAFCIPSNARIIEVGYPAKQSEYTYTLPPSSRAILAIIGSDVSAFLIVSVTSDGITRHTPLYSDSCFTFTNGTFALTVNNTSNRNCGGYFIPLNGKTEYA